ncbi:MAG: OPT/YSL family transporter [bacterium]
MQQQTFTVRSLVGGFVLAIIMAGMNSYLTLKVGLIEEGPIVTMMLFVGVMMIFGRKVSASEAAMVATMGSAGGGFGFIANFFAAFVMIGHPLTLTQMVIFPTLTSMVGLMVAIPLRQLYVVHNPLPWPTSQGTIAAIEAVTGEGGGKQAKLLLLFAGLAGAYVLMSSGLGWLPEATLIGAFGLAAYGVGFAWSPFIIGAGYLIKPRVGFGFLVGAIILAVLAPYLPTPDEPHKFLWPGVMFLVTGGLTTLAINYRTIGRALTSLFVRRENRSDTEDRDVVMSPRTFQVLSLVVALACIVVLAWMFHVVFYITIAMLAVGGVVFNLVATRAAGESGFNPIRVVAVMLQGVCALLGGVGIHINLTGAGFAAASIGQTSILVQDGFFGRHFQIPARWQWLAQLAVLLPIAGVSALIFNEINQAYPLSLDGGVLPAPVAKMWATMALIFSGQGELPEHAVTAMWIGGVAGILYAIADGFAAARIESAAKVGKKSPLRFFPHSTGIGIALIIPIAYSLSFFLGALVLCIVLPKVFKVREDTLNTLAAAGIVGEGVMGLIVIILMAAGVLG